MTWRKTMVGVLWALVWCCTLAAGEVHAQAMTEAERVQATLRLHHAAVSAFARGEYQQAIDGFSAANRLTPRPAFVFNVAKAYDALHDASHALEAYREYLRQAPSAQDEAEVAQRVSVLTAQLVSEGIQQVNVLSEPPGAEVFVDGEPVGSTPLARDLSFGEHEVSLSLDGYRAVASKVQVSRDRPLHLTFALVAIERVAISPPQGAAVANVRRYAISEPKDSTHSGAPALLTAGFVSLGAGVAALGAALVFEVLRANTESNARQEAVQTRFAADLNVIKTQQTLARVLAGTGVALAAVGGVLLSVDHAERKPTAPALSVACLPSNCQGVLTGVF